MKFKIGECTYNWAKKSNLAVWYEEQTASTNALAKETELANGSPIALFVTEHQTAGRGRGDHLWEDLRGSCLLSSWVFRVHKNPQPVLSIQIGLAIYKAFSATWPYLHWSLKAPNDLYLGSHKVGGLLIEYLSHSKSLFEQTDVQNRFIVGFGFNVHAHPAFETATSLASVLRGHGLEVTQKEWNDLLDRMLLELSITVSHANETAKETASETMTRHQCLSVLDALNKRPGMDEKFIDIDPSGNLTTKKSSIHWSEL